MDRTCARDEACADDAKISDGLVRREVLDELPEPRAGVTRHERVVTDRRVSGEQRRVRRERREHGHARERERALGEVLISDRATLRSVFGPACSEREDDEPS